MAASSSSNAPRDSDSQHAQWLEADSDSDSEPAGEEQTAGRAVAVAATQTQCFKTNPRKRGRRAGDAEFRAQMKRALEEFKDDRLAQCPQPGSIAFAREALSKIRKKKAEEKQLATSSLDLGKLSDFRSAAAVLDPSAGLHFVGTPLQQKLMSVGLRWSQFSEHQEPDESKDVLDFILDTPSFASQRAVAQIMKTPRTKVDKLETLVGPCLIHATSWITGAFFSSVMSRLLGPEKPWKAVAFMTSLRYDEASLKLWLKSGDGFSPQAKVLQTEFRWHCLFEKCKSEPPEFCTVSSDMLTFLQVIDHHSAENLLAATSRVMSTIPELERFSMQFSTVIHHACTDKHSANMKCERLRGQGTSPPRPTIHVTCTIHKLYSSTACCMKCVDGDVSGILNLGLVHQASSGVYNSLLLALAEIFKEHLQVCYQECFDEDPSFQQAQAHRQAVLDLFLPVTQGHRYKIRNAKRRFILERMLNCDWQVPELTHNCQFSCCRDFDHTLAKCIKYCSWAICPTKCPKFCRSRWTRYDESIDWAGLVSNICGGMIFDLLMQKTLGKPSKVPSSHEEQPQPGKRQSQARPLQLKDAKKRWEQLALEEAGIAGSSSTSKSETQGESSAAVVPVESADPIPEDNEKSTEPNWAEINAQKRREAAAWVISRPGPRLVVIKTVVKHLLHLMGRFLFISSPSWEKAQQKLSAQGLSRSYPVLEAATGQDVVSCMLGLSSVLFSVPSAVAKFEGTRKLRNLFFQLVCSAMCGLHSYIRVEMSTFPVRWFLILVGEVAAVYSTPACFRDEFVEELFQEFPTPESARTPRCTALTEFLAGSIQLDTARIEARHSSNRETTMQRARGWFVTMQSLNSKFVVRQFATKQGSANGVRKGSLKKKKPPNKTKGGGAWRAFLHHRYKGHKFTRDSMKLIAAEYRSLSADDINFYLDVGQAATDAHRQGHKSFPNAGSTLTEQPRVKSTSDGLQLQVAQVSTFEEDCTALTGALVATRAEDNKIQETEEEELQGLLQQFKTENSGMTIIPDLLEPLAQGLTPVPTLKPFVRKVQWQPDARNIVQAHCNRENMCLVQFMY